MMPSLLQISLEVSLFCLLRHYQYYCNLSLVEPMGSVKLKRKKDYFYLVRLGANDGGFFYLEPSISDFYIGCRRQINTILSSRHEPYKCQYTPFTSLQVTGMNRSTTLV